MLVAVAHGPRLIILRGAATGLPGRDPNHPICLDGQEEAFLKWREQAGPVFGFTAMAGDGYRIKEVTL
jgi:hypothetical protein